MEEELLVAAFYQFVDLVDYVSLRAPIKGAGVKYGVRGTVLLAPEGINSTIAGTSEGVRAFLDELASFGLSGLEPKFSRCAQWPFRRWRVRLKKEIVTIKNRSAHPTVIVGDYVDPCDWNDVVRDPETVVIDVRNKYEIEYGSFKNAINPQTEDFWEFAGFARTHLPDKERPLAMFCTGGIRCEKATALLLAQGYKNVKHLRGGVLAYLEEVPKEESLWEGKLFVFDDREALDHDLRPAGSAGMLLPPHGNPG